MKEHLKIWEVEIHSAGEDTVQIKTRSLGEIRVIRPSALEAQEYTVVGSVSASRARFTGSQAAAADAGGNLRADVFSRIPFSRLIGYLPTSEAGAYIAVRKPGILPLLFSGVLIAAAVITGCSAVLPLRSTGIRESAAAEELNADEPLSASGPESETGGAAALPSTVPALEAHVSDGPSQKNTKESKQGIVLPGWGSITIDADTENVTVDFYNPEKNEGRYYLTFELRLRNGEEGEYESLYQSGLVEPGKHVTDITLNRPLSAGEYEAAVFMQPYTLSAAPEKTNSGSINIKLIVK